MDSDSKYSLSDVQKLERETLKELCLDTLKSSLVHSFKKLHQEQLEIFEDKLSDLKEALEDELRITVSKHIKDRLKENFQDILDDCQTRTWLLVAPLVKRSEDDVKRLENAVAQTESLCERIQNKYRLRWGWPFLPLLLTASLASAMTGLMVFMWLVKRF
jgi:hypothetical protein